ncbi:MAG TPA: hypothetical protein VFS12_14505 [Terriglobia bacterium]|nr:hypothetical protein [Terriglobia bacterium]
MARATTLLVLWILLAGFAFASEPQPQSRYPTVAANVGEICVVCGMPVSSGDIAIILKGRRMPVMKDMAAAVLKDPEIYFKSKQAKGALFQEDFQAPPGAVQAGVSLGWFLAGLYVLSALIFGGLSGVAAVAKGLPPISSFCFGLGLSVFGYLYVLTTPSRTASPGVPAGLVKVPVTQSPLACPQCGNTNHPAAPSCAACHVSLSPQGQSDLSRAG